MLTYPLGERPGTGPGARASLKLQAKGERMPDTTFPFQVPVTARLYAGDGTCGGIHSCREPERHRNVPGEEPVAGGVSPPS